WAARVSSFEPPPYRLAVRRQVLRLSQRDHVPRDVLEGRLGVVDDMNAPKEGLHRQAAGMPGGAGGRQHMVGSGAVVAEANWRVRSDENGSGRTYPAGHLRGVGGLDLEMFCGVSVHDLNTGIHVVDQDDRRLA